VLTGGSEGVSDRLLEGNVGPIFLIPAKGGRWILWLWKKSWVNCTSKAGTSLLDTLRLKEGKDLRQTLTKEAGKSWRDRLRRPGHEEERVRKTGSGDRVRKKKARDFKHKSSHES